MKIAKSTIPSDSLSLNYLPANYTDVYKCEVDKNFDISPDDLQFAFWTSSPPWVQALFKIRNSVVKFLGLKGDNDKDYKKLEECIRSGGSYNMFSVMGKSDKETVIRLTDKHLDAYMSVYISDNGNDKKDIALITVVHLKNSLGYLYFYAISPFHKIVVKGMLKYTLNRMINPEPKEEK